NASVNGMPFAEASPIVKERNRLKQTGLKVFANLVVERQHAVYLIAAQPPSHMVAVEGYPLEKMNQRGFATLPHRGGISTQPAVAGAHLQDIPHHQSHVPAA